MIPRHVAIIMDGNGRWAKRRGRPRFFGHIRGAKRVRDVVEAAKKTGVSVLTLYAFSKENWDRDSFERNVLWKILLKYLDSEVPELAKQNISLGVLGEVDSLPVEVQNKLRSATQTLSHQTGMRLNLALSYSGRSELIQCMQNISKACLDQKLLPSQINESVIDKNLWTAPLGELSNVDLLIRTSGEKRISNFLLWQSSYAEFYFTDILWPDFTATLWESAITEFASRERRFGR